MVPFGEVSPLVLVSLANRDDFYSLVATHGEYTHSTTTELNYDWATIEHKARQRFVGARGKIKFTAEDLPVYMFQEDFNLWNQMEVLAPKQVCIHF